MAKPQPVTEQEISLRKRARRRLVGAVALVLVVAVVLPWVVDDDPPPRLKNVDIAIPAVESVDRKFPSSMPPAEPIPAPGAATSETPAETPAAAPASEPADAPSAVSPQPVPLPAAEPDPEAAPPKVVTRPDPKADPKTDLRPAPKPDPRPDVKAEGKPAPGASTAKGFVMQVGAFSSPEKAKQLQQQLRAAGFPAYLESIKTASGDRIRVRAGPFATIEAAQKARTRLLALKVAQGDLKVVPREN
jgi:DedD protein